MDFKHLMISLSINQVWNVAPNLERGRRAGLGVTYKQARANAIAYAASNNLRFTEHPSRYSIFNPFRVRN